MGAGRISYIFCVLRVLPTVFIILNKLIWNGLKVASAFILLIAAYAIARLNIQSGSYSQKKDVELSKFKSVFNLSQVTSAVPSTYIRLKSTSVKKKADIDVCCSESFLNSLKTFKESGNVKIFQDLQNVKFGPKFEDIQWIFKKKVNFRFAASNSVNDSSLYVVLNKNDLKSLYFALNKLKCNNDATCQLKQFTLDSEEYLLQSTRWCQSYISKKNFDENKKSSSCGSYNKFNSNSPVFSHLFGSINSYSNKTNVLNFQKRGFKTKRVLELEDQASPGLFPKFGRNARDQVPVTAKQVNFEEKIAANSLTDEMISNHATTSEEKLKLKASFAEGYMVAAKDFKKPESKITRFLKYFWAVFAIFLLIGLLNPADGKRKVFIGFGHHGEIDPEEINVNFSDVKGVDEVKDELMEIVEFLRNPAKFSNLGGKLPKGVLLVGPPGTGKTLLARALAGEANVPFFHVSGSEFDEIFVGEGARRVRNLFKSAKARAPSIIFIDEIDCVGSKRKSTMLHPYANQTINQLLSEMDGFSKNEGVIVIGATNRKADLDSALLRPGRFDVEVQVPLPDLEGRKEILEFYMKKVLCKDIDIQKMARTTAGCTGADLEAIINHAAIRAATDGASFVSMKHLENAKDKIMIGPERKSTLKAEEALMTAYHEGGHAIVAYFTEGADSVDKITIVARGETLGHTACVPEDIRHITKNKCLARLDVLLGGRAAEELIYGPNKITANASDDLEKATTIATSMVKNYGMSEKLGVRTFSNQSGEILTVNPFGQTLTDQVDMEVKRLIQESYERSKNILKKHAKEHKLLAEALVKYKTLNPEEVRVILGESTNEKMSLSSASVSS